ncbi:spore coat protein CotJB [Bacillus solimangrovi]|nr:spore coat protein CotJB [Bacillus solimangrovi]
MEKLQAVDFALIDLTLYLDTHPKDAEAVQQFNDLAQQSMHIRQEFEQQFGPLQQYGNSYVSFPFSWKKAPWPWQV